MQNLWLSVSTVQCSLLRWPLEEVATGGPHTLSVLLQNSHHYSLLSFPILFLFCWLIVGFAHIPLLQGDRWSARYSLFDPLPLSLSLSARGLSRLLGSASRAARRAPWLLLCSSGFLRRRHPRARATEYLMIDPRWRSDTRSVGRSPVSPPWGVRWHGFCAWGLLAFVPGHRSDAGEVVGDLLMRLWSLHIWSVACPIRSIPGWRWNWRAYSRNYISTCAVWSISRFGYVRWWTDDVAYLNSHSNGLYSLSSKR